ncbi:MAG TPA: hypothetical protein VMS17_32575, partial [Gemmataceae bacterium]|nr:hypothetical protein [Gemmataceae bacterium]
MAFHPFHIVRKHQKLLLALATIFCMVVFILQFGSGDVFSRFGIGRGNQAKGEPVVKLYGKDLSQSDINQILQSRRLANQLITSALEAAEPEALKEVVYFQADDNNPADLEIGALSKSCIQRESELDNAVKMLDSKDPQERQRAMQTVQYFGLFNLPGIQKDYAELLMAQRLLAAQKPDAAKAKEQDRVLLNLRFLLRYQYLQAQALHSSFYFGGGVKDSDLLDFEIWKHQAEKLGVVLNKADARRALAYEAGGHGLPADPGGSWKDEKTFEGVFKTNPQATEDQAAAALADEFRVQIAQNLLGGPASGVAALDADSRVIPKPIAPYDFWEFYRDNRTTLKTAFLALPVRSFESDVTEAPDPNDLRGLYDQFSGQVPDPSSPNPGFRKPHRVRIQYLTAWTDPRQFIPQQLYISAALPGNTAAAGPAPVALALGAGLGADPMRAEYNRILDFTTDAHATNAVLAGDFVGLGLLGPAAFPATAGLLQGAIDENNRQTSRQAADALTIAASASFPGAALESLASALAPPTGMEKEAFPHIVQPNLSDFPKAVMDEMKRAREEADKKNAASKTAADRVAPDQYARQKAAEFIEQQAKKNGWELTTGALDDRFEMKKDEALKTFRDVLVPRYTADLAREVFDGNSELYSLTRPLDDAKEPRFVIFWLTEDEPERPVSYGEALPAVLEAWKLEQARKRAFAKAEEISAKAQEEWAKFATGGGQQENLEKFFREQPIGKAILPPTPGTQGIARLVPALTPNFSEGLFSPFSFPPDLF